jgi:S1-C subfamily serine protease
LNTQPGQEVQLTLLRGGETQEITVELEERPENLQEQP